jgi:hypothetical protein
MSNGRMRERPFERLPVQIFSIEDPFVSESCTTQNINSIGARLLTGRSWAPECRVIVKSPSGSMWARARVVYCQPLTHKEFAVGLEFLARTGELVMRD